MAKSELMKEFELYWKKYGRRNFFKNMHRYLRLHKELLEDPTYKSMYEYYRNTLIAYYKKEDSKFSEEDYGVLVDVLADLYNEGAAERVEKYRDTIERLKAIWKYAPNREVRV